MKKILLLVIILLFSLSVFAKDYKSETINTDWYFITDPANKGESEKYFNDNTEKWLNMPCNTNWETVIGDYDGFAWYKRFENFSKKQYENYKYVYLSFGAVDEEATVYVNGKKIGEHTAKSTGLNAATLWNMAFNINIKSGLKDGKNNITIKVHDQSHAGGIYLPVKIIYSNKDLDLKKDIIDLNPYFEDIINQALKTKYVGSKKTKDPKPFSLLHFSDIHGDKLELERLVSFYEYYKDYFNDIICSGDIIPGSSKDSMEFWDQVEGIKNVMFCIGNHDALNDNKTWNWANMLNKQETYDLYFKDRIKNWNVQYKEGEPYYYKDYKENKVRLIVLDVMLKDEETKEQCVWFKGLLDSAKKEDLSVIVVNHFPSVSNELELMKSNWTYLDGGIFGDRGGYVCYKDHRIFQEAVDEFMNNDGKFVCWIGGHSHRDALCYDKDFPNQLNIIVDASSRMQSMEYDDFKRIDNQTSMDLANAMVVDTGSNLIKIIRIGANRDRYLRDRSFLCINYKTKEIIVD